jgi:cobalt-zinc-cadmium resistance protein CzcA
MLEKIIAFSLKNKLIVLLFTSGNLPWCLSTFQISIGAVPDVTNNHAGIQFCTKSFLGRILLYI